MTKKNISDFLRSRGDAFDHPIFVSAAKVFDKGDLSEAAEFLTKRVGLEFPNAEVKNSYIEALFVLWKERGEDITGKSFPNEEKRRRFLKKTLSFQAKEIRKDGGLYGDSNAERQDFDNTRTGKKQQQDLAEEEEEHARLKEGRSDTGYAITSRTYIPRDFQAEKRERKNWWDSSPGAMRSKVSARGVTGEDLSSTVYRKPSKRKKKKRQKPEGKEAAGEMILRAKLTPREQVVWDLIGEGFSDQTIARHLKSSEATIRWHRTNIRKKYGVE